MQPSLKETTVLHLSDMQPVDEAPPIVPPTLLHNRPSISEDFSQSRLQPVDLQSSPLQPIHHYPDKTTESTSLSEKSSLSLLPSDSSMQSEAVSQQSLSSPPGELSVHNLVEEDRERQVVSPKDPPTPLTGSRSGSLTDVSMCSEDSLVIVQSHDVEMQSISLQKMKTDPSGKTEDLASNSESTSESSSACSSPRPTLEAKVAVMVQKEIPATTSERFPISTTSTTSMNSPQSTSAPLDTLTSVTITVPSMPCHTLTPHHSTAAQERSPQNLNHCSTLSSEHPSMSTHEQAPPLLAPPPPLPTFRLPNFFMTPQQLEESMRSLRAGALSRAPPRTNSHYPPPTTTTTTCTQAQCSHHSVSSVATHLKTLQEVRSYLESRRTAAAATDRRPKAKEISSMETQRLARIFSS